ncbi:MAG: hypothetical protein ACI97A_003161 [Planctomycetota bacterium]|jgi:hypothetical protein
MDSQDKPNESSLVRCCFDSIKGEIMTDRLAGFVFCQVFHYVFKLPSCDAGPDHVSLMVVS